MAKAIRELNEEIATITADRARNMDATGYLEGTRLLANSANDATWLDAAKAFISRNWPPQFCAS